MSLLSIFGNVFRVIGSWARRAFGYAQEQGLTDDLLQTALQFVTQAQHEIADNEHRREWVVAALRGLKVPESIARLALELAVQLYKQKQAQAA